MCSNFIIITVMLSATSGHGGDTVTWINETSGAKGRKYLKSSQQITGQRIKVLLEICLHNVAIAGEKSIV